MMISRGLFGWSPPHIQPLTPVSEVSEPPESPSPYLDPGSDAVPVEVEDEMEEAEEIEPPPAAVPFSRLFACADRLDWVLMVVGSLAAAAHGTALVVYLHYFAKIVHLLSHGSDDPDSLFDSFKELALTLVYIAVGVFAAGWIEVSCWILTGERQTAVIRSNYVQVLLNQDMSFFDTYGNNGDIVSQVLSDVLLIQSALSEKVGNYIHNMATFFSGLAIGFVNCWQIALITLATGPFIVAAGGISNIFLHRLAENIQDAYAEAASVAEQAVSYIRTLYAFTNETLAKYSYAASLQATLRYGILISLVQGFGLGFTYGLAICSCALQLWVGRFLVKHGRAHGGEIVTALFAVILSGLGLNQAATNFYSFEQGRIAAYRLYEMISRSSSTVNHDGNTLVSVQGNIEFRNVYFSYLSRPEIPILSGFYLTVPAKKTVALVGRNGSGKSSIIPLMERFYDPTLGEVLLDGENIKNLKLEWLRSQIGLVTQEPALLSLSIRDNIAYGRDATSLQIEDAAKIAHAHTFISSLEKGYETQVGRAGLELTEEQKIRLSVARAVLSNPSILLLDEVTGGLDFEAERSVQEALDLLMLGRSTIIIARRLSLIRNADYIAVMEEGQLVEMGTHDELINLDGLYAELLRCEEAAKLPRRMPVRTYNETAAFQIEKDSSASHSFQEPSSPKLAKSPSLQRASNVHAFRPPDVAFSSHESPRNASPPPEHMVENGMPLDGTDKEPTIRRQDSFEMRLPELPKIDVQAIHRQSSNASDPESPVSPLLTSDPKNERSHSQTFSRPLSEFDDVPVKVKAVKDTQNRKEPSFWRLVELSFAEWLYAVLGSTGAAIFGSFNPLLAYVIALIVTAYYRHDHNLRQDVDKWCLIIACMGVVTVVANFLQHFYFGIMGEKMTERVRRMMFSAMLRNEVGWFDEEENSADTLSMRLANDATFVRAAFSNRLSIFIQDSAAIIVAVLIGMLLYWRLALVALATLPVLTISAIAQVRNVVIEQSFGAPKVTKDGVTVAKSIEFKDRDMNVGASLVKQVANATNDIAGDGTTCATILTRAILSEGCKSVAAGVNAMDLRRGITMAIDAVVENLKRRARMISTSQEISQVGTISANGEREIGELIAKAMEKVGKEGVITIQDGKTLYNELEVVEGMKLDRGYISPHFITNQKNQKCELEDPVILIHEKKISNMNSVIKVLELALKKQKPLLIVAEDVESDALATLIINKLRIGIKVCAVKAPGFGESRKSNLQDLATLTGGELITEDLGMDLDKVEFGMLGSCKKVTISKDNTVILNGAGDKKAIEERCQQIRSAIELSTSDYDKEKLQDRLAKLSGGVAVLKIGGASELEVGEKKDRVTDALNATKAAVEEGIVPGGGVALLYASKELDKLQAANFDQRIGVQIIQNALKAPVHTIASNAGAEGSVVVGKLLEQDNPELGYDAAKGEYVNMVESGIIDPLKVIRTALVDAASVSSLMTTTEAIVVEQSS